MAGTRSGRAAHHSGKRYVEGSKLVRDAANADPLTVCSRCGLTLPEHRTRSGKPDVWQAGHTVTGSTTWTLWLDTRRVPPPGDWLAAEARSCNAPDGARIRNAKSSSAFDW